MKRILQFRVEAREEFDESVVTIYAVFHGSRDPMQWQSRIAKDK